VGQLSSKELYEGKFGGRAPLLGTPKDMPNKNLETGVYFYRGPRFWGRRRGGPFLGHFREGKNLYFMKFFNEEFERYVKNALQTGSSLHRGLVVKTGGRSLTVTFDRKRKCIFRFLFLDPEDITS